jgi:hypothetical protein
MIALLAPITVTVFYRMGLYRENWRLAGIEDFARACGGVLIATAVSVAVRLIVATGTAILPLYSIYAMVSLLLVIGSRASHQFFVASQRHPVERGTAALIYGAGRQGVGALRELLLNVSSNLRPVAFIDDDPTKAGRLVSGVPVAGSVRDLEVAIRRFEAGAVIVTTESIPDARLAAIGAVCDRTGVTLLKMQITFDQYLGTAAPSMAVTGDGLAMSAAALGPTGRRVDRRLETQAAPSADMGWKMPNAVPVTPLADGSRMSAIISLPCPSCRSLAVHRSHARRFLERLRKKLTSKRPYRCQECGWRGWCQVPDVAVYQPLELPPARPALESIDLASPRRHAAN